MKKITKLLMGLSVPTATLGLMATVACSKTQEKDLKLTLNKHDHVLNIATEGEVKTNTSFNIVCSFERGWSAFDASKTKITVGNKVLVENTDFEYSSNKIIVKANVIKEENVIVDVYAKATIKTWKASWKSTTTQGKIYDEQWLGTPGEKFTKDDIIVKGVMGDGSEFDVSFGTGKADAKLLYDEDGGFNYKDVTSSFLTDGFKVEDKMIKTNSKTGKKHISQISLAVGTSDGGSHSDTHTILAIAGYTPNGLQAKGSIPETSVGDSVDVQYYTEATNEAGFPFATFVIESQSVEGMEAKIENNQLTVKSAGTVGVKATSIYGNNTIEAHLSFKFNA